MVGCYATGIFSTLIYCFTHLTERCLNAIHCHKSEVQSYKSRKVLAKIIKLKGLLSLRMIIKQNLNDNLDYYGRHAVLSKLIE